MNDDFRKNLEILWESFQPIQSGAKIDNRKYFEFFEKFFKFFGLRSSISPKVFVDFASPKKGLMTSLSSLPGEFSQQNFEDIIRYMIIITNEENHGHSLFSRELAALLNYNLISGWQEQNLLFTDPKIQPFFEILSNDLKTKSGEPPKKSNYYVRREFSIQSLMDEIKFYISKSELNLINQSQPQDNIFSFETFKELFLERNL